jgi:small-conductance mechanosensitive channel
LKLIRNHAICLSLVVSQQGSLILEWNLDDHLISSSIHKVRCVNIKNILLSFSSHLSHYLVGDLIVFLLNVIGNIFSIHLDDLRCSKLIILYSNMLGLKINKVFFLAIFNLFNEFKLFLFKQYLYRYFYYSFYINWHFFFDYDF